MNTLATKFIPAKLGYFLRNLKLNIRGLYYSGKKHYCPLCSRSYRKFFPGGFDLPVIKEMNIIGAGRRKDIICPGCASTDRDRLIHTLLISKEYDFLPTDALLHIAPEPALYKWLNGNKIEYINDAYVYDEKVQNVKVFTQQRRRWLSAQFHYFGMHFRPAVVALIKNGNVEYFNKAYHYMQLPRIILLGMLFLLSVSAFVFNQPICPNCWFAVFLLLVITLLLAIPKRFYEISTLKALLYLPIGFAFMLLSLLKIRGANKKFIHTKHTYNAFQIKKKR
jgi:hypothetical protein